jgi:hypothetical protein
MTSRRGNQERSLGVVLPLDVDEVLVQVGMLSEQFLEVDRLWIHVDLSGKETHGFSQAADRIDIQPLDDGGFRCVGPWNEQPIATFEDSLKTHRQDTLDGPGLAGEGQLTHDGIVARPVETDLAAAHQQSQCDRQVEAVGIFFQVCRSALAKRNLNA